MAIGYVPPAGGVSEEDVDALIATAIATRQLSDADLTELAALSTTAYGRGLLEKADQAALLDALGSGRSSTKFLRGDATYAAAPAADVAAVPILPTALGFKGWNCDPAFTSASAGGGVGQSNRLILHKVFMPEAATVTNIVLGVQTAGSSFTAGQNLIGIYSADGQTLVGSCPDQSGVWNSAGIKTMPLSAPVAVDPGSGRFVWVGFIVAATTRPQFVAVDFGTTTAEIRMNNVTTPANYRWGYFNASVTALPASFDPTAMLNFDGGGKMMWVGLS